jgi:HEPN domain-containing protein
MYVDISKDAVLFYKALEDIWCAERTYVGSPNNAVWSCCQSAEKILKGFLRCCGVDSDNTHDLSVLLEYVEHEHTPQKATTGAIYNLARYDQRLRYKNLKNDPTPEDAQATIEDAKVILSEFAMHIKSAGAIGEAKEVHEKMLRDIDNVSP